MLPRGREAGTRRHRMAALGRCLRSTASGRR